MSKGISNWDVGENRLIRCTKCSVLSKLMFQVFLISRESFFIRISGEDFPGGPAGEALSCNAAGVGSIPGWGTKIPHAPEQ